MTEELECGYIKYLQDEIFRVEYEINVVLEKKIEFWEILINELEEKLRWGVMLTEQERYMHHVYWIRVAETFGKISSSNANDIDREEMNMPYDEPDEMMNLESELAFFLSGHMEKRLPKRFNNKYCTSVSWQRPATKRKAGKGPSFNRHPCRKEIKNSYI